MIETEKEIGPLGEVFIPISTTLGLLGLGLCFFCNPCKIAEQLPQIWQSTFWNLVDRSNEQPKVKELLKKIPDGEEDVVARAIIGAMSDYKRGRFHGGRRLKAHQIMIGALLNVSKKLLAQ